jgi:hypothetical protein
MKAVIAAVVLCLALAGCGTAAASRAAAPATVIPRCQAGYVYDMSGSGRQVFSAADPGTPAEAGAAPGNGYRLTLTNTSGRDISVSQFSVVLYDGGSQAGSDTEPATGIIAPGQSLTWVSSGSDWNLPAATSCALASWSS